MREAWSSSMSFLQNSQVHPSITRYMHGAEICYATGTELSMSMISGAILVGGQTRLKLQSTPHNSNIQRKLKKQMTRNKGKNDVHYAFLFIHCQFESNLIREKSSDNGTIYCINF